MGTPKKLYFREKKNTSKVLTITTDGSVGTAAWQLSSVVNSGTNPTWYVTGSISPYPTPQTTTNPIWDLTNKTGMMVIKATLPSTGSLTELKRNFKKDVYAVNISEATDLTEFEIEQGWLTEIDVSNNLSLTRLILSRNQLTSIDLSNNDLLETLAVDYNNLTSSFNSTLSGLTGLTALVCNSNSIGNVDISNNTNLITVNISSNGMSGSKSFPNNTTLLELKMGTNPSVGSVDVSNLVNLTNLQVPWCGLSTLDITNNPDITYLTCHINTIPSLNLSAQTAIEYLNCSSNNMSPTSTDDIWIAVSDKATTNNTNNGTLIIRNNRTVASDAAYSNLIGRSWTISETTS